ncbi:MAG: DinB family protein [Actinomycetota bacterium]|nr:DinB family protein [Actinomycetota bacterium]
MPQDEIIPDDKDWTFVITEGCSECSFAPFPAIETSSRIVSAAKYFEGALAQPNVSLRPAPGVWSPLEYSCHVRDVFELFEERLSKMIQFDNPEFDNWDQDQAAIERDYQNQRPEEVLKELQRNAEGIAKSFASVTDDQWQRSGLRSNGSYFTIESFAIYFIHDIEHHIHDIELQLQLS